MNDNLRYISLQYIKGDNYEEITCFDFERINKLLDIQGDLSEHPKQSVESLKDVKEEERCKIGESFLNDLVNYYNFKDIKKKLERSNAKVKSYVEYDFDGKYKYDDYNTASKKLVKLFKEKERELNAKDKIDIGDGDARNTDNTTIAKLITDVKGSLQGLLKLGESAGKDNKDNEVNKKITVVIEKIGNPDVINRPFISELKTLNSFILNESAKNKLYYNAEKKALDELSILLDSYIKLCAYNITKYDNIFKQNDISNIDDAFMIESYSKFLKKLDRLKKNLESKDEAKLLRDLTHTLDRLFNLYGVNDPEKLLKGDGNKDALKYIAEHILNYR
jgi:hypothetical protein